MAGVSPISGTTRLADEYCIRDTRPAGHYTPRPMEREGDGVLGRLPNSRPGTRSGKRDSPGKGARPAASKRTTASQRPAASKRATSSRSAAGPKRTAAPKRPATRPEPPPEPARPERAPTGADPVTGAVRAATRVAETGLKVAGGVTREVLRRLPRP